jgi:hypothetical protein
MSALYVSIGKAARHWGVCRATLRRWADRGVVDFERTPTGHRRFRVEDRPNSHAGFVIDITIRRLGLTCLTALRAPTNAR